MSPARNLAEKALYGPVNRCIYCGATGVPLFDEHPFPDGMGGRQILLKATCKPCEVLINREFEAHCLREMFGNIRSHIGLRSSKRSRRKRPPQPLKLLIRKGHHETEVYSDKEDAPIILLMPLFPEPYVLGALPPPNQFQIKLWAYNRKMERLASLGADAVATHALDPEKVARWIAKIAHGHGTAVLGDAFTPCLPEIILGKNAHFIEFVGGLPHLVPKDDKPHRIALATATRRVDGKQFAVAILRFFGNIAGPVYYAVLGELVKPWPLPKAADAEQAAAHTLGTSPDTWEAGDPTEVPPADHPPTLP